MVCSRKSLINRSQRINEIGNIGEILVREYLTELGHHVLMSENKFDSVKDMTSDGQNVEVKTLVPIKKFNSFCLGSSQWNKCDNADQLFFVKIPDKPEDSIMIYESIRPRKYRTLFYNNDNCRMYPLTNLKLCVMIKDIELSTRLDELSPSKYRGSYGRS